MVPTPYSTSMRLANGDIVNANASGWNWSGAGAAGTAGDGIGTNGATATAASVARKVRRVDFVKVVQPPLLSRRQGA